MIDNNDKDKNDVNGPDSHLHVYILHEKGHFSKTITIQKKKKKKKKNGEKSRSRPILSNFSIS